MSKKKRRPAQPVAFPPRAWWRPGRLFGPGMLFALVMAIIVWFKGGPRPNVERPTVADARPISLPTSDLGLIPEPAWLLRHAEAIPLTAGQTALARRLAAEWQGASDRTALETESAALRGRIEQQRSAGGARPEALTRSAEGYSELSANLAARRHAAWDAVWATLDETQRSRVTALRRQAPMEMR